MIRYIEEKRLFVIETEKMSYVFGISERGVLLHAYYGERLFYPEEMVLKSRNDLGRLSIGYDIDNDLSEYRLEYATFGRKLYDEESLKLRFSDGVSDVDLLYESHEIKGDGLYITLYDNAYRVEVILTYKADETLDLIERSCVIKNHGDTLTIENAASANIYLPTNKEYEVMSFSGMWGQEYTEIHNLIPCGKMVFETSRTTSSGPHHVPFFAVHDTVKSVTETDGVLYYGMLKYSGNFRNVFEKNSFGVTKITSGINFHDAKVQLKTGESFETPPLIFGYTDCGTGGMRKNIYRLEYERLSQKGNISKPFPIIYNSWYPYEFDINEEKMYRLIDKVEEVGAELLVIDDGWMEGRVSDRGGLGDWYPDKKKFPGGLLPVSKKAHEKGLLFGLWVEPEMINENSELYRIHPEWVLSYQTREQTLSRNQLVLNFAREDVYCFARETVDRLIEEYELDYLKWDMNRYISEKDTAEDFDIRYTQNMMRLYKHLREKYPHLLIENCAHGGARADFGLFEYCDRINRSDNADPVDVLRLHEGFATLFPPRYAGGAGNIAPSPYYMHGRKSPVSYRADLGMTGSMSIGIDILTADEEDMRVIEEKIKYYKTIRPILHNSYFYVLSSYSKTKTAIWQYTARDGKDAVIFIFAHGLVNGEQVRDVKLQGLIADMPYTVNGKILMGDTLMKCGIDIAAETDAPYHGMGDYFSRVIEVRGIRK